MAPVNPVCYYSARKNREHSQAIAMGWKARAVPIETARMDPHADLHLCGGLQFGGLEIMQEVRASGAPYVFFDRAYFGGGPGSGRLRAVPGAYQKHWIERWPDDRLKALGVEIQPWRKDGRHILLVPPGGPIAKLFDLGLLFEAMPERLARITKRQVVVSRKGDQRPLADRLAGCHCVVTWTSNVAVEAICAGVPAFVSRHSAAAPMAGMLDTLEDRIENPPMPDGREGWAASLAYGQFTLKEIIDGYCAEIVMAHFSDEGEPRKIEPEFVPPANSRRDLFTKCKGCMASRYDYNDLGFFRDGEWWCGEACWQTKNMSDKAYAMKYAFGPRA